MPLQSFPPEDAIPAYRFSDLLSQMQRVRGDLLSQRQRVRGA